MAGGTKLESLTMQARQPFFESTQRKKKQIVALIQCNIVWFSFIDTVVMLDIVLGRDQEIRSFILKHDHLSLDSIPR